jgi:parvulin-like peptidyl-prolyl isomerase
MKFISVSKILSTFLIFSAVTFSQNESDAVAIIGSDIITVEQFQNRFDFMPHLNYSSSNIDSVKKEFLYSLIAEKLWALEADELGIDTNDVIQLSLKSLQKLFVKDELYKKEVESKISVSSSEITTGLSRVTRVLNLLIIATQDSQKAFAQYNDFQKGVSFDSVLVSMKIPLNPIEVKYGSLEDEAMEEVLYSLRSNEISKPIKANNNWFIFKLVSDEQDLSIDPSKEHAKNIVIKKLKDRKSQKLGRKYLDKLLSGVRITADRKLFDLMSDNLLDILKERTGLSQHDSSLDIQLQEADVKKTLLSLKPIDLNAVFIALDPDPITMKEFLFYVIYQKVYFDSFNAIEFKKKINMVVRKFIEDEIIAREGFKLGLNNLPSVKNDLQIWKYYYLSEALMNSYADSIKITDEEINKFTTSNRVSASSLQINIREILVDNLEDAEKIINELNEGKEFESLVGIFNQREWTKKSNGEWGIFNPKDAGEIGRIASELNIGQVYGPIKVSEGFSIFQLIDKRNEIIGQKSVIDQDSLKFIRLKIALSKMDNLINAKTVSLAKKYNVSIDGDLLTNIETSKINTFTYRFIGFGGKIAAYPITVPIYEWHKQYQQKKEIP